MKTKREYTYLSDIEITKIDDSTVRLDPIGVDLEYLIKTDRIGDAYADFPGFDDFCSRDDVSLSKSERFELLDYLDAVARGVN